jgi:transketolase
MRLLPNMSVYAPSEWNVAAALVAQSIENCGPKYFRFDGKALPSIYDSVPREAIHEGFCELVSGKETCLVATGFMTHRALKAARDEGSVGVIDIFRLKPLSEKLVNLLSRYKRIITVEEGFVNSGGLDSAIIQVLKGTGITADAIGFNDRYLFELGTRDHLHALAGIDESAIILKIREGG